jgi:predicted DNA-binding transcriptional regulator AlpA
MSDTDLTKDRLVNMAFITAYTGLTDKWFYKLIKDGEFRSRLNWAAALAGLKVK